MDCGQETRSLISMSSKLARLGTAATSTMTVVVESVGVLMQVALIAIGLEFIFAFDDDTQFGALILWCVLATVYLAGTVLWLNIDLRTREDDHVFIARASSARLMALLATASAFLSSAVGLVAAVALLVMRQEPDHLAIAEVIPLWAMLLSWAMFHWGYARLYHSRCLRAAPAQPIRFPGTDNPRLTDFVYFSFTNGTTFGVSDSMVNDSKMRWTVVWHTTLSFFFNALIIVLTMNTIAGGFQGL